MNCYRNAMLLSIINEVTSGGHEDGSPSHKLRYAMLTWTLFLGESSSLQAFHRTVLLKEWSLPLTAFIVLAAARIK